MRVGNGRGRAQGKRRNLGAFHHRRGRPDGGTPEKPVGLVYVGVAGPDGAKAERLMLRGDRDWIRTLACQNAFNLLRLRLLAR